MIYKKKLALNFAWTPLFFGAKLFTVSALEITALLGTLGWTTSEFFKIDSTAGYLMVPYCGWVSYATALTWTIWYKNSAFSPLAGKKSKKN
jgi:benzodiazapine receptor